MPIYVRGGSIIPIGPKVQSTVAKSSEPTILKVYPGADASFSLYYDDDRSYDYEEGEYSIIEVTYNDESGSVSLSTPHDKYVDFAKNPAKFTIEIVGKDIRKEAVFDAKRVNL